MKKYIDLPQMIFELREIIKTKPDFVYPDYIGCDDCDYQPGEDFDETYCDFHYSIDGGARYWGNQGFPVCVMGHWLDSHDLDTVEKFGKEEVTVFEGLEGEDINSLIELAEQNGHINVTSEARDFAKLVQVNQDHFMSWRDSFNQALPNEMLIKERISD